MLVLSLYKESTESLTRAPHTYIALLQGEEGATGNPGPLGPPGEKGMIVRKVVIIIVQCGLVSNLCELCELMYMVINFSRVQMEKKVKKELLVLWEEQENQ